MRSERLSEGQPTEAGIRRARAVALALLGLLSPAGVFAASPAVDGFTATPPAVAPGQTVQLVVSAHDLDCADTCTSGCGLTIRSDLTNWSATAGTFLSEDNGTPASPYTASARWQAPAIEATYTITVSLSDSGTFMCGGRGTTKATLDILVSTSPNQPPEVASVTAAPVQLFPGQTADLACLASDPDGDPLDYSWSADSGSVTPSGGSSAIFVAAEPGVATITCTATDTGGASASRSTGVSVTDAVPEARFTEGLATPQRVAVDSLGDVYVADRAAGGLVVLSLLSGEVVYRLPLPGVQSVAVDWQDHLLVGGAFGARVVGRGGEPVLSLTPGVPLGDVADVAVDPARQRYAVLYRGAAHVVVYDAAGAPLAAFGSNGDDPDQLKRPRGVAINPAGQIVVGDGGHGQIKVFDLDGTLALAFGSAGGGVGQFVQLDDVAVDQGGVVYASDSYQDWVQTFNPDGTPREVLGTYGEGLGRFRTPAGVAPSDTYRRLVVASLNSSCLQVFRMSDEPPTPPSAGASLSTESLTFSLQAVGTASAPQAVSLTNTGGAPLGLEGVALDDDYAQTGDCDRFVDPGASCTLKVTFAPQAPGPRPGTLALDTSAGPAVVALTGEAFVPARLGVSPLSLSFSDQPVGTISDPEAVILRNEGTVPLLVSQVRVSEEFAVVNGCGASLAGGTSCSLDVYFAPHTAGDEIPGTLSVETNAGVATVALEGRGVLFDLTVTPGALDLGRVLVDEVSDAQIVSVTNTGGEFAQLGSATLEGLHPEAFVVSEDLCSLARLEMGEECHLTVAFSAAERGAYTASLRIPSNAGDSPDVVLLAGSAHEAGDTELIFADGFESGDLSAWTKVVPPVLEIPGGAAPSVGLDFGEVGVGTSSAPLAVTVLNVGDTALALGPATLDGSHRADFRIESDRCARERFGKRSVCVVQVAFAPTVEGEATAELLISTGAGEIQGVVSLTGVGLVAGGGQP